MSPTIKVIDYIWTLKLLLSTTFEQYFHSVIYVLFFGTKLEAIDPTITALSAVNIIVIKIILVKIMSSSIKMS